MIESSSFVTVITGVYTVSHITRLAFYWPQIRSVMSSDDAAAIAVPTWIFWSFHNFLTVFYLCFVANDFLLGVLFFGSGICTAWIALFAIRKQKRKNALPTLADLCS